MPSLELAALDRRRLAHDAVAGLPQAGAVPADQESRVGVDAAHPVAGPLECLQLPGIIGHLPVARGLAGVVEPRAGLIANPAPVMKHRRAHRRLVRARLLECVVAPVRGKQTRKLSMIVLGDHHDRAVRFVSHDHLVTFRADLVRRQHIEPKLRLTVNCQARSIRGTRNRTTNQARPTWTNVSRRPIVTLSRLAALRSRQHWDSVTIGIRSWNRGGSRAAKGGQGAGRKDRADARRRQGARAARPLSASRRSVVGGPAGVSGNDLLRLSRLDLQARHRGAGRGADRRSRLADLRQGRRSRAKPIRSKSAPESSGSTSATNRIRPSKRMSPRSSWSRTPSSSR